MRISRNSIRFYVFAAGMGLARFNLGAAAPTQALPPGQGQSSDYERDIKPILGRFCHDCHNNDKHKGGLSFEAFPDVAAVRQKREVWGEVVRKLRAVEMPPQNKPQPSQTERDLITRWIQAELFPVNCNHPDPGRVTLRRLNRAEYNNTIRDLVGVDFQPAADFPADDTGHGFDTIGDVLSVSPLLLEKYLSAAEKILDTAIVDEHSRQPPKKTFSATEFKSTGGSLSGPCCFCLFSQAEVFVTHEATALGEYRLRVVAYGQQAGPEPARMALRLGPRELQTFDVKAVETAPGTYEWKGQVGSGRQRVAVAFLNDYYKPDDPNPARRDRNLFVQSIEIIGPLDAPPPPLPDTHRRIFICQPTSGTTNQCARTIIAHFAQRAFRRPVRTEEIERLAGLAERVREDGAGFETSIKVALQAVLVSPHFLFRGELQPDPNNPEMVRPVDDFALASRLSYFLWSSMPDEELFGSAAKNELRTNLVAQTHRLLRDPKARALVENFAGQWLQIRNLALMTPDQKTFPEFDEALRMAMARETELLFEHILREDHSVLEFLTADYTFANERLARHYGLREIRGPEFRRVSLHGTPRGGVLTHGSVLTLTSNPTRTSPVKRGKWVLENLLASPPPPPPPDVPPLGETKEDVASATLRQRLERHREDPLCASCHERMDPIGFALEHFDGVGAWRDKDGVFEIDSAGQLHTGEAFKNAAELRAILAEHKRDQFVRCLAEKMLTYALGRGLEYYDECAVNEIAAKVAGQGYRFSALIQGIVESVPFQMRRGEGERLP